MKFRTYRKLNFSNVCFYLSLDAIGVMLAFFFVVSAFLNEYRAVFLMSVLILAVAWVQSCIDVFKRR